MPLACPGRGLCLRMVGCCPPCDAGVAEACARAPAGAAGPDWPPRGHFSTAGWCGRDDCAARECANFMLCRRLEPPCLLDMMSGRCMACSASFGSLAFDFTFMHSDECPVCMSDGRTHVRMPACTHTLCTACAPVVLGEASPRCPLCRARVELPASRWDTFATH